MTLDEVDPESNDMSLWRKEGTSLTDTRRCRVTAEAELGDVALSPWMPEEQLEETKRTLPWSPQRAGRRVTPL